MGAGATARRSTLRAPGGRVPWATVLSLCAYAALSLVAYWPAWPGDPARVVQCPCGDVSESAWFLAWTPHAVLHGLDPFFTTAVNHPFGINLAGNATMPLLGVLVAPVTLTAGPAAAYGLLLWLAAPLSAAAMFAVLRRWGIWHPAAFAGGLLYGFSPYMVGQGRLHLNLVFVPLPPLVVLAVHELFVRRRGSALRWGALLGGLVAAQYLVSTEILATTVLVTLGGLALLAVTHPRTVRTAARHATPGLALGGGIAAAAVAYPTWVLLAGPRRYHVPVAFADAVSLRATPAGSIAPTHSMLVDPGWLAHLGQAGLPLPGVVEDGSYLGIPLLLLAGYLTVRFRRDRWLPYLLVMAAGCVVLSLGPHLIVGRRHTGVPLPFLAVEHLPLLDLATPVRLSLYAALFVSVLVARGWDDLHRARVVPAGADADPTGAPSTGAPRTRPGALEVALVGLVSLAAAASLVPRWPVHTAPTAVPRYFTDGGVDRVPRGGTVLAYPYPVPGHSQAMLWQAAAGMRFDLLGSYALHPVAGGLASQWPTTLRPTSVQGYLYGLEGAAAPGAPQGPGQRAALAGDLRRLLGAQGVTAVLVSRRSRGGRAAAALVATALGRPPVRSGGVDAWYGVAAGLATTG